MPYLVKMEAKIAKTFNEQVQFMIDDEKERDNFYTSLNCYQENHNIQKFVTDLLHIICEPKRLPLYEDIRFLVPPRDQIAYDRLIPRYDLDKMRMVRLARHCDEGLGFSVRGGFEHEVGIYVSEVDSGSQAHKQGLKVGDEIVLLNGFTIGQAIHQEVLNLIKARKELVLKVRHVGMTPVKNLPSDKLTWKYVDIGGSTSTLISDGKITSKLQDGEEVNLYINIPIHGALGCSVCSGPRQHPGIYIQSVKPTSLAEEAGLEVGDQVIRVNDVIFNKITHSQAVVAFKSSKHLDMVIRKGTGIELFKPRNDPILSCMENKENQQHLLKDVTDHNNKGNMSEEKIDAVDWSRTSHKQEDLIEAAIQVIDTNNAARPSSSSSKLAEAVKVMGQSSTDKANGQRVKADIHSRPSKDKQPISTNTEKRPRLYRKNHEPIYSSIEEVTSQPAQRISTGFDEPPSKHHPFPEASTDFRGSPSYETSPTTYMTEERKPNFRIQKPVLLHPTRNKNGEHKCSLSPPTAEELIISDGLYFKEGAFNLSRLFTNEQIAGRQMKLVNIKKEKCTDLGIVIEASLDRVIVGEMYAGGAIQKQGGVHTGDQIMMVDRHSLIGVTIERAYKLLKEEFNSSKPIIQLVVAKAPPSDFGDEVTYF